MVVVILSSNAISSTVRIKLKRCPRSISSTLLTISSVDNSPIITVPTWYWGKDSIQSRAVHSFSTITYEVGNWVEVAATTSLYTINYWWDNSRQLFYTAWDTEWEVPASWRSRCAADSSANSIESYSLTSVWHWSFSHSDSRQNWDLIVAVTSTFVEQLT